MIGLIEMNSAISFRMMSQNMFDDLGPPGPGQNQMMGMPGPGPSPGPMPGPGQMPVSMPGPFPPPRSMGPQFGMPPGNKVNVHVHLLNKIFNETKFYVFKQKIKSFPERIVCPHFGTERSLFYCVFIINIIDTTLGSRARNEYDAGTTRTPWFREDLSSQSTHGL